MKLKLRLGIFPFIYLKSISILPGFILKVIDHLLYVLGIIKILLFILHLNIQCIIISKKNFLNYVSKQVNFQFLKGNLIILKNFKCFL